jgi:hypothetical protein
MAKSGEQGIEKDFLRGPDTDNAGKETIHKVTQQGPDHGARDAASKQAEDSADNFAPPVTRDLERFF